MSRPTASDRVRRVLALVPWLSANSPTTVDEVCRRFSITRAQLLSDLEVLPYVGVPPYSPDTMIEVDLDGDHIAIRLAEPFDRPLRLTPSQALALIAAGHHIRQVPGVDETDPLQRALTKLANSLGVDPDQVHIDLGDSDSGVRTKLLEAISDGRRVEIDYYTLGRGERSTRTVDPYQVVADEGNLYLLGWCHRSDDVRVFRLDRITALTALDEKAAPPASSVQWDRYRPGADVPRVTLVLAPQARWVVERYPCDEVHELDDGGVQVTVGVANRAWLEQLLLVLGPNARVITAPPDLSQVGSKAAERLLARYRGSDQESTTGSLGPP